MRIFAIVISALFVLGCTPDPQPKLILNLTVDDKEYISEIIEGPQVKKAIKSKNQNLIQNLRKYCEGGDDQSAANSYASLVKYLSSEFNMKKSAYFLYSHAEPNNPGEKAGRLDMSGGRKDDLILRVDLDSESAECTIQIDHGGASSRNEIRYRAGASSSSSSLVEPQIRVYVSP